MAKQTIQRVSRPSAILVGLDEPFATTCMEALNEGGLVVFRVGHVAAACERLPVVMPQLVVVPVSLGKEDGELIADRCVAVGAELLPVDPATDPTRLRDRLKDAANIALVRSMRQTMP